MVYWVQKSGKEADNMGFQEAYKRLEKLCGEITGDTQRGVTAYIEEMGTTPGGRAVVGWDEDLRMLKHCRWARNRISHEPGCTEENTCEPGDTAWVKQFRKRIMTEDDPLARYRKMREAKAERAKEKAQANTEGQKKAAGAPQKHPPRRRTGAAVIVPIVVAVILIALIVFIAGKAAA